MRAEHYLLKPDHIAAAAIIEGHTHLVIRLEHMTWSAKLMVREGELHGFIRDEHNVPMEGGAAILSWILEQPEFILRIWTLARHVQPSGRTL